VELRPDTNGRPAIIIALNEDGTNRMEKLTVDAMRTQAGRPRRLAILLDKQILSAPELRSRISKSAMISGGAMSDREVQLIVNILKAGELPAPIEFVDERRIEQRR
jgi:preprotein translocase subunit SecD